MIPESYKCFVDKNLLFASRSDKLFCKTDSNFKKFKKQFRWMWLALALTNLDVSDRVERKDLRYILCIWRRYFFVIGMLGNVVFLTYTDYDFGKKTIDYRVILQILINILPFCLWLSMYVRKRQLRRFFIRSLNSSQTFCESVSKVSTAMKVSFIASLLHPPTVTTTVYHIRKMAGSLESSNLSDFMFVLNHLCTMMQEQLFLSVVTAVYCVSCLVCVRSLKGYQEAFRCTLDARSWHEISDMLPTYSRLLGCIEDLHDIFSLPLLFVLLQNFSSISFSILDMVYFKESSYELLEESMYLLFSCSSVVLVTSFAAQIPLEVQRVKCTLSDISFSMHLGTNTRPESLVENILKRETSAGTAYHIFTFDRGFFLKALGALITQAIVYYQISKE